MCVQACPTLCAPTGCSPPGSSVHGILQAGILELDGHLLLQGSSWPGIEPISLTSHNHIHTDVDSLLLCLLGSPMEMLLFLTRQIVFFNQIWLVCHFYPHLWFPGQLLLIVPSIGFKLVVVTQEVTGWGGLRPDRESGTDPWMQSSQQRPGSTSSILVHRRKCLAVKVNDVAWGLSHTSRDRLVFCLFIGV